MPSIIPNILQTVEISFEKKGRVVIFKDVYYDFIKVPCHKLPYYVHASFYARFYVLYY